MTARPASKAHLAEETWKDYRVAKRVAGALTTVGLALSFWRLQWLALALFGALYFGLLWLTGWAEPSYTVKVYPEHVYLRKAGLPAKIAGYSGVQRIEMEDVQSARQITMPRSMPADRYHFNGKHPTGVELQLRDGRIYQVGSADPAAILAALTRLRQTDPKAQ
jgi:hypothetical protein